MLAEKRIDLSLYSPEAGSSKTKTKPEDLLKNEQNVRNRRWEVTYSDHIKESVFSTVHRSQKSFYHLFIITIALKLKMKLGKKLASNIKFMERNYEPPYKNVPLLYIIPTNLYPLHHH